MKRALVVAALVCLSSIAVPAPASAGLMDWLQELSGPGPFNGKYFNVMVDMCPAGAGAMSGGKRDIFATEYEWPESRHKFRLCFFADNRRFTNGNPDDNSGVGDNFGAGRIDVHAQEFGASARVHPAVSLGFGVGWIKFNAKDRGAETTRFLVTAPRIVLKPALIFGSKDFWEAPRNRKYRTVASVFKFYIRNNIIHGDLTGADFGLRDGDANFNFAVRHDRVWSSGFIIDLSEVLGRF